jgi:hypothetical protein
LKKTLLTFLFFVTVLLISGCSELIPIDEEDVTGNFLKTLFSSSKEATGTKEPTETVSDEEEPSFISRITEKLSSNKKNRLSPEVVQGRNESNETYLKCMGLQCLPVLGNQTDECTFNSNCMPGNSTDCLDADYNFDLQVTVPDLGIFAGYYRNGMNEADLDYDGNVTLADFAIFGSYFNNCDYTNETG